MMLYGGVGCRDHEVFFFRQKRAYEMRISDWSSDVCSSDLAAASLASGWFHLPVDTVASRFGALPSGLPAPHWPEITQARLIEMLPSAFVIAFLAGVESLLSAIVADRMFGGQHRPSAELLAPGRSDARRVGQE